ncbi:MAG TPA: hypothetical protein VKF61_10170 [Candidatus Polarisedimenticolia bacterium]|nr:hypothetical protein [Candidatus Polarisedimenticolia bacterium]
MSRRARATVLIALAYWPGALAQSWTDTTRARMIKDALKISPPALRQVLQHYEKELLRGMLDPSRHENEEVHYQHADGKGGLAAAGIERKTQDIIDMLSKEAPFGSVTYEMGVLAHLVSDVEFPLSASDADPREPLYRDAYRKYVEKMLDKIPFVVDREPPPALEKNDIRGFVKDIARRSGKNYKPIGPAFKDDGTPASPTALDERSLPFGITSLSYSHATSDIAWIWRHLWVSINGDMRGTPFLGAPPPEKVTVPPRPPKKKRIAPQAAASSPSPQATAAASPTPATQAPPRPSPSPAPQSSPKPSPSPTPGARTSPAPQASPTPVPRSARS